MTTDDLTEWKARYLEHHRAKGHSPKTITHYTDTFKRFHRFLAETDRPADSSALTTPVLQAFSAWMRITPTRGCRGTTQRSVHGLKGNMQDMKAFTRWLQDEELIDWRIKVELPKLPEELFPILTDEEILRVWKSAEVTGDGEQKVRNRALLALMFDTGVRLSEVAGIQLAQLDLDNYGVVVMGKGMSARTIDLEKKGVQSIKSWLMVRPKVMSDHLFLNRDDEPLGERGVQKLLAKYCALAGITKRTSPHSLRLTIAHLKWRPESSRFSCSNG